MYTTNVAYVELLPGTRTALTARCRFWTAGAGMNALRKWSSCEPCCSDCALVVLPDRRRRCNGCGTWWSASHSDGVLAVARAADPIGIDVQIPRRRDAALRWLGRISGVAEPTIGHWALAEATLKAIGEAHRRPTSAVLTLPEEIDGYLRWRLPMGIQVDAIVTTARTMPNAPLGTVIALVRVVAVGVRCDS